MARYEEDIRAQARQLRDTLLAQIEDKTDPRYQILMDHIEARREEREASAIGVNSAEVSARAGSKKES
jgi:hypothetical protein